mmetsp:Transcript_1447/g.3168  ORF Transcript_1447/g.3168 Transcript_1447/m.3168 type:complete len:426 (+) Transcript_1447:64-1341(+)
MAMALARKCPSPQKALFSWTTRRHCAAETLPFANVDQLFNIENCFVMRQHKEATGSFDMHFSQSRYEEFLAAEMHYLGQGSYRKITLEEVLRNSSPALLAKMICRELPPRFATRMRQIEGTAADWMAIPGMQEAHDMYTKSFRNLRFVETDGPVGKQLDLHAIADVVQDIKARHDPALPNFARIATALRDQRGLLDQSGVSHWLWKVIDARVGTDILTSQYLELLRGRREDHTGIVNMHCNPKQLCFYAIQRVESCLKGLPLQFELIEPAREVRLPFIDKFFSCIVEELLKNAAAAALVNLEKGLRQGTQVIRLELAHCDTSVAIKVSDEAGGIEVQNLDRIWDYMFSLTPPHIEELFTPIANPLTVPAMGLPLTRLYTEYLGGKMAIVSMPGIGVDAWVRLKRIDMNAVGAQVAGDALSGDAAE